MTEQLTTPTPKCPYCGAISAGVLPSGVRLFACESTTTMCGPWQSPECKYRALLRVAEGMAKACVMSRPYVADSCRAPVDGDDSNYGDRRALNAIDASVAAFRKLTGAKPCDNKSTA